MLVEVLRRQRLVGRWALTVQQAVPVAVARAALGELPLQRHVDARPPGVDKQPLHRVGHVGQPSAVDGGQGVGLAPHRRGVGLFQRPQNDGDTIAVHGIEGEPAAGDIQLGAPPGPGEVLPLAAAAFLLHCTSSFLSSGKNKKSAFSREKALFWPQTNHVVLFELLPYAGLNHQVQRVRLIYLNSAWSPPRILLSIFSCCCQYSQFPSACQGKVVFPLLPLRSAGIPLCSWP